MLATNFDNIFKDSSSVGVEKNIKLRVKNTFTQKMMVGVMVDWDPLKTKIRAESSKAAVAYRVAPAGTEQYTIISVMIVIV